MESRLPLCKANTSAGKPCRKYAILGGTVCPTHGASAPQVKEAARKRILAGLLAAAAPAAARLAEIALDKKNSDLRITLTALKDLLDRAGIAQKSATEEAIAGTGEGSGQVLWDEFIQIHRRRAKPQEEEDAET